MISLDTATAVLQLITSAIGSIDTHVSAIDHDEAAGAYNTNTEYSADVENHAAIAAATTTTILAASGSATKKRNAKLISIRNKHASVTNTVTLVNNDGATSVELFKCTLQPGESLIVNEAGVPFVYDANGGVKMGASAMSDTVAGLVQAAVQSDMEGASSTIVAVTPGRQHFHPSASKCWVSCGVAADIQQSYNVTSLTDTGTGIVTVTINVDFAAANYCAVVSVEKAATTLASTDNRQANLRFNTRAAGSCAFDCKDDTATTNLIKDPASWHISMFGDLP
jgi:hypothetical protein